MARHATIAPDAPLAAINVQLVASSGRWRFLSVLGLVGGFVLGLVVQAQRSAPSVAHAGGPDAAAPALQALLRPTAVPPTARTPAVVALCVGGLLELTIPQRGQSVADHVLSVLQPDVFVAGTLKGWPGPKRVARALEEIGALRPFARVSVVRMPTVAVLREALQASGHWDDFLRTASGKGSGQVPGMSADKRKWLPLTTSPVIGNPKGNTLQELHYQSRCIDMVGAHETDARRGAKYERVMFTRLEFEWLHDHPPLHLLDPAHLWLPTGEDNEGVNDRHWVANRRDAERVFRRWDTLLDGDEYRAHFGSAPLFVSSEIFMGRTVRRHRLQIARFPSVAMLQCCALNYLDVRARAVGNMSELQCFARRCFEVPCPSRAIGACAQRSSHAQLDALAEAAATQVGFDPQKGFTGFVAGLRAPGQLPVLSFKYEYEGRAAVMHATALSFPGAAYHLPSDRHPPRLDIALPRALGSRLASAAGESVQGLANHSYFYSCINCERGEATGCLDRTRQYGSSQLERARKSRAPCLYYDRAPMAAICSMHADAERNFEFRWWCAEVERDVTGL